MILGQIIDYTNPLVTVEFQYMSGLSNGISAVDEEVIVPFRSEPHDFYSHTNFDMYNFKIQLAASSEEGDDRTAADVWNDHLVIKSFQYPDYSIQTPYVGFIKPPHLALIVIGDYFSKIGKIRDCNFDWSNSPIDEHGRPLVMDVTFTFKIKNERPLGLNDILNMRVQG